MDSHTNEPKLSRQIMGAAIGMIVAGSVYVLYDNYASMPLSALLVGTSTISENTHQVRVNDKNVDDVTLRTLERNARTVTANTQAASDTPSAVATSPDTILARTEIRREERVRRFADDGTPMTDTVTQKNTSTLHSGAPLTDVQVTTPVVTDDVAASALPNSGFGTAALVGLSALGAGVLRRRKTARA